MWLSSFWLVEPSRPDQAIFLPATGKKTGQTRSDQVQPMKKNSPINSNSTVVNK